MSYIPGIAADVLGRCLFIQFTVSELRLVGLAFEDTPFASICGLCSDKPVGNMIEVSTGYSIMIGVDSSEVVLETKVLTKPILGGPDTNGLTFLVYVDEIDLLFMNSLTMGGRGAFSNGLIVAVEDDILQSTIGLYYKNMIKSIAMDDV